MPERAIPEQAIFARNLKLVREAAGISQQDLADRAGLDRSYVSNLERGVANPSLMKMANLSTALSTSVRELLKPDEEAGPVQERTALCEIAAVLRRNGIIE